MKAHQTEDRPEWDRGSTWGDVRFNRKRIKPGTLRTVHLPLLNVSLGDAWPIPVTIVHGARPGPCITIIGGIHGDELTGPSACTHLLSNAFTEPGKPLDEEFGRHTAHRARGQPARISDEIQVLSGRSRPQQTVSRRPRWLNLGGSPIRFGSIWWRTATASSTFTVPQKDERTCRRYVATSLIQVHTYSQNPSVLKSSSTPFQPKARFDERPTQPTSPSSPTRAVVPTVWATKASRWPFTA